MAEIVRHLAQVHPGVAVVVGRKEIEHVVAGALFDLRDGRARYPAAGSRRLEVENEFEVDPRNRLPEVLAHVSLDLRVTGVVRTARRFDLLIRARAKGGGEQAGGKRGEGGDALGMAALSVPAMDAGMAPDSSIPCARRRPVGRRLTDLPHGRQ